MHRSLLAVSQKPIIEKDNCRGIRCYFADLSTVTDFEHV